MFKYSYDALVYYGEEPRKSIERCAKFGYDAIELCGEPDYYDVKEINQLCKDNNIVVSSICSVYNAERDLAHPDKKKREQALDYVKKVADFAAAIDCHMMIAGPTAVCKTMPLADLAMDIATLNHFIRKVAHFTVYLVLGILTVNSLKASGVPIFKAIMWALVICIAYAATDEIHQMFVPGRGAQVKDVLIDSVGAVVGICVYYGIVRA